MPSYCNREQAIMRVKIGETDRMTQVWHKITDCVNNAELLSAAAERLRSGGLVVFPTETVYGLGANGLDAKAVRKIFDLKGRPAHNPLILHVADSDQARRLTTTWPREAEILAAAFWPGPLTLVLPKADCVPDEVTAGGPTVAIRVPVHPVALELLRLAHVPVAAPSANRSGEISPTKVEHVLRSFGHRIHEIDLILDAGPTQVGLESTVVSLDGPPTLLRPGMISVPQIEEKLGLRLKILDLHETLAASLPSPGLLKRHYAPHTPLELRQPGAMRDGTQRPPQGERWAWVTLDPTDPPFPMEVRLMPSDPKAYAARLYDVLHELDALGLDRIIVDLPPAGPAWQAIHNRLTRAAAQD